MYVEYNTISYAFYINFLITKIFIKEIYFLSHIYIIFNNLKSCFSF